MLTSENIADLAAALTKAQAVIEKATKDSANDAFKRNGKATKYADLTAVWDACRDALTANNLSVVQAPGEMVDNRMALTTMLLHSSGQFIRETLTIPLTKVDAQGYGSATTYARRYALAAMVGVSPEDDDGNAASQSGSPTAAQRPANDTPANTSNGRQKPEPLKGKHKTRAAARIAYGEIVRELHACADDDGLEAYLATISEDILQFQTELPSAWDGDGADFKGLKREIDEARIRCTSEDGAWRSNPLAAG